ncbi:hypothetical protein GCK32_013273 [Trichostrongylus colubriformis]|uniref:Uncharacterized protein n=1 Tax=Trichostrongylus colubriformis TaxID=6319 RepID=A0AAN8EY12_TRICO
MATSLMKLVYLLWKATRMRHTCQCDRFVCRLVSQFGEVSKLLRPVMLNMAMTLTAWIYVYEMKTDERLSAMFLMSGNSTTGNQYHDGIINAFSAMIVLAVVSFSMLLLALWDCRRLVQLWLHLSCLLILFAVSGGFFYDLLKSLKMDEEKIIYEYLPGLVTAYGGFGCIAFFYPGMNGSNAKASLYMYAVMPAPYIARASCAVQHAIILITSCSAPDVIA